MIVIGLLFVAVAAQAEGIVEARSRRVGAQFELVIAGKFRPIPDGVLASIRFRRVSNRVDWESRNIVREPLDRAWGRFATVERGKFQLRELFSAPCEVEVDVSFPDATEDHGASRTQVWRVGTVSEVLAVLAADARKAARLIVEARNLLENTAGEKSRTPSGKVERARALARGEAGSSLLSATSRLLDLFLSDLETAVRTSAPFLSSVTGEAYTLESACDVLGEIERIARREQRLVFAREAAFVAREIARLAESGDARRWAHAEPSLEKSLQSLGDSRDPGWSGITEYLADLEVSFSLAPTVLRCPASVSAEWEKIQSSLSKEGADLDESLRRRE